MDKEQKRELATEILGNMKVTREQYVEMCRLCDELDLDRPANEPEELSWDEVIKRAENK